MSHLAEQPWMPARVGAASPSAAGLEVYEGRRCERCGASPAYRTPSQTLYHWDPESTVAALTEEANLLALDCVGLQSFARLAEVEEQRIRLDDEIERGGPNADLALCAECSDDYTDMMDAQWSEYYAGLL